MREQCGVIDRFDKYYRFLSNYYNCEVTFNGYTFMSSEAAFHAQKNSQFAKKFVNLTPGEAKRLGRRVRLRSDWEEVKDDIMFNIVLEKFIQNPHIAKKLIGTGSCTLIEGNNWGDTYWGVCDGKGENRLGEILMRVRDLL